MAEVGRIKIGKEELAQLLGEGFDATVWEGGKDQEASEREGLQGGVISISLSVSPCCAKIGRMSVRRG